MTDVVKILKQALAEHQVLLGEDVKERYEHIWRMDQPLDALAVLLPSSTEEMSQILQICNKYNQPVVLHGGLTNLVGNTITDKEEIVISTERMNKIEEIDQHARTISVQCGVILEEVQNAVKPYELLFPLNFGAKGSAQIGGIISTNAGGLRVFKYGMTRNLVLGLEVVLADGTILSSMKKIIKDNSGYDLKQLFIGSEGTLGIVTKAVLKLVEAPKSRVSAMVGLKDYDSVVSFLKYMDRGTAGTLSGFELMWNNTYKTLTTEPAVVKPPIPHDYPYYVLLECLGSNQDNDLQRLEKLLETALEKNIIIDAAIASTEADLQWFWTIREDVRVMLTHFKYDQQFDISIPIPLIGEVANKITAALNQLDVVQTVFTFGHVADGNVHFVVGKSELNETTTEQINDIVYSPLKGLGGSVSAEHGIGVDKKKFLKLCRSDSEIATMKLLKKSLDPKNILNRGKIITIE